MPLLERGYFTAQKLLVENLKDDMAGSIVGIARAPLAVGAERAEIYLSRRVTVKRSAHPVDPEDIFNRFSREGPDHFGIAQTVARGHGVPRESFHRIAASERSVEAALGDRGIRPERMDFGDEPDRSAGLLGGNRSPKPRCSSTDNQNIERLHLLADPFFQTGLE
jgi:hypothetical protein